MKNLIPSTGLVTDSWIPGMGMYERARNLLGDPVLSQLDQAEKQLIQNYQSKLGGRLGQSFVNPSDYTQKLQSQIGDRVRQDLQILSLALRISLDSLLRFRRQM